MGPIRAVSACLLGACLGWLVSQALIGTIVGLACGLAYVVFDLDT